jgi:hypothetical protein
MALVDLVALPLDVDYLCERILGAILCAISGVISASKIRRDWKAV